MLSLLFVVIPVLTVGTCHISVIRELYENLKPENKNIKKKNSFSFEHLSKLMESIIIGNTSNSRWVLKTSKLSCSSET